MRYRASILVSAGLWALCGAAGAADDAALARLAERLAHGTPYQRSEAGQTLQREGRGAESVGDSVLAMTVAAITARDWRGAALGVDTLAAIKPAALAGCLPDLQLALAGSVTEVRVEAARLAASLGPAGAPLASTLVSLIHDHDCGAIALRALAAIGPASDLVVPALRAATQDQDARVASSAIDALERLGPQVAETIPALSALLGRDDLRLRALAALGSMRHAAAAAVPQVLDAEAHAPAAERPAFIRTLQQIETCDIPPLGKDATATCHEGGRVDIALAIDDPDDAQSSLKAIALASTPPSHGKLRTRSGVGLVYEAEWGFVGEETLTWKPNDSRADGKPARVTVTVTADATPPAPLSFLLVPQRQDLLRVGFDRPLEKVSAEKAENYALDREAKVTAAALMTDQRTVELTTSGLEVDSAYQLSVHRVADRASAPQTAEFDHLVFKTRQYVDGLAGQCYAGQGLQGAPCESRIYPNIAFPGGPMPGKNDYSMRLSGFIEPPVSETFTFSLLSDDGSRLWVNGQLLIDAWHSQSATERSGTIALQAHALYEIKIDYFQGNGPAALTLSWSSPSLPKQIVPAKALRTTPPPPSPQP